jgi:hypothetical protein
MQITEALERRTIDYAERMSNGDVMLHCTDGHSVHLGVHEDGHIELKAVNVSIFIHPMM